MTMGMGSYKKRGVLMMRQQTQGFTLIELVIVLVLIGILAAVAIPKFQNMQVHAQESSVRGTLGNVRSAIHLYNTHQLSSGVVEDEAGYNPPYATFESAVLDAPMPFNPFADKTAARGNRVRDASGDVTTRAVSTTNSEGWAYDEDTGEFWANIENAKGFVKINEW